MSSQRNFIPKQGLSLLKLAIFDNFMPIWSEFYATLCLIALLKKTLCLMVLLKKIISIITLQLRRKQWIFKHLNMFWLKGKQDKEKKHLFRNFMKFYAFSVNFMIYAFSMILTWNLKILCFSCFMLSGCSKHF